MTEDTTPSLFTHVDANCEFAHTQASLQPKERVIGVPYVTRTSNSEQFICSTICPLRSPTLETPDGSGYPPAEVNIERSGENFANSRVIFCSIVAGKK